MEKQSQPPELSFEKKLLKEAFFPAVKWGITLTMFWAFVSYIGMYFMEEVLKNDIDNLEKDFQLKLETMVNKQFLKKTIHFEDAFFNNRPGANGEDDLDWECLVAEVNPTMQPSALHPKFLEEKGRIVAAVWKLGFDQKLIQGLSNSLVMKTNTSNSAETFCAAHGTKMVSFTSVKANMAINWKAEVANLLQWFYPAFNFTIGRRNTATF